MVGHQVGVGAACRRSLTRPPFVIGQEAVRIVFAEQAAHVADVVEEQSNHRVQPFMGAHVTLGDQPAAQNGLTHIGDQQRVLQVVIGTIAAKQGFQRSSCCLIEHVLVAQIPIGIGFLVALDAVADERVDQCAVGIEHR